MTSHSSKGLEWPIVFIPRVMNGDYPSQRCVTPTQLNEERRVIYVGCTRAQILLYLTYNRNLSGLSEFVQVVDPMLFQNWRPELSEADWELFGRILRRSKNEST